MKFLLYLEPDLEAIFRSASRPVSKSKSQTGGEPAIVPLRPLPVWAEWLWEHKQGQALDASVLWTEDATPSKDAPKESSLAPAIPLVILLQRPFGKNFEDQAPWPKGLEQTDDRIVLILQTQSSKTHLTLLRGSKSLEWAPIPAPANILKALKAELHWASGSAQNRRRLARHQMHMEEDALLAQSFARLIEQHYLDTKCTIPHLAKVMGISGTRLQLLCQKHLNTGAKAYLIQARVHKSCELIRRIPEGRRCVMSKIARDSGFSSPSYFAFVFMKFMGMTPTEYRHKALQIENI